MKEQDGWKEKSNFDALPTEFSADVMRSSGARMALYSWNPGQALYPHTDRCIQASLERHREALGEAALYRPGPTLGILLTLPEVGLKNPSTQGGDLGNAPQGPAHYPWVVDLSTSSVCVSHSVVSNSLRSHRLCSP